MNYKNKISFFEIIIFLLSIYVIVVMIVQLVFQLPDDVNYLLWMIDNTICAAFIIDFLYSFYKADNKLQYMKYGWIDLIASIPNVGILRFGRLAKVIRIFRIFKAAKSIDSILGNTFKNKAEGVFKSVTLFAILLMITSSLLILTFESSNNELNSPQNAFWWTIYTFLGMSYCMPTSFIGKLTASILAISGMSLLGSFTAYLSGLFVHRK